jgi:hypothetical protein
VRAADPAVDPVGPNHIGARANHILSERRQLHGALPERPAIGVAQRRNHPRAVGMHHDWMGTITESLGVPREAHVAKPHPRLHDLMRREQFAQRDRPRRQRFTQLTLAARQSGVGIRIFLELPTQRGHQMRQPHEVIGDVRARRDLAIEPVGHLQQLVRRARRERAPRHTAVHQILRRDRTTRCIQRGEFLRQ